MEPIKDGTLANFTSITALGAVLMEWETTITIFVLFTALLLNIIKIYDWWVARKKNRVKKR